MREFDVPLLFVYNEHSNRRRILGKIPDQVRIGVCLRFRLKGYYLYLVIHASTLAYLPTNE